MTDLLSTTPTGLLPGLAPSTDPTQQQNLSGMSAMEALNTAVNAAPELSTNPGLAVGVAQQSGNTALVAQSAAHAANLQALQKGHDNVAKQVGGHGVLHSILGFFSTAWHDTEHAVGTGLSTVAHLANAPLQFVQHEYRYLHDVEATHGALAAIMEGLGIAAGAIGGGLLAGPSGAILGGEAAAGLEGQVSYKDSWQRTTGPNYVDPNTHQPVSLGRDVASLIGLKPGTGTFNTVSGIGDAIGDLTLDPLGQTGRILGAARSAEGAKGALGTQFGGLAPRGASTVATAGDVERVYQQYPSVRRAFDRIASLDAGGIQAEFPQLANDGHLLQRLGEASTPEQVKDTLTEAVRTNELTQAGTLPTLTLTRDWAKRAAAATIGNAPADTLRARVGRALTRLPVVFEPTTKTVGESTLEIPHFSHSEFSVADDYGANAIYKMVRMGETDDVARSVANAYLNTSSPADRIAIYRNAVVDTLIAMAKNRGADAINNEDIRNLGGRVDELLAKASPAKGGIYGVDDSGHDISPVVDPQTGRHISAAITANQVGKLALPDFTAMKRAAQDLAAGKQLWGRADDFLYDHITQGIFKKLVLLSGGFATRVALSEDIPNSLRLGVKNLVVSRLAASAAKAGFKESLDDDPGRLASMSRYVWNMLGRTSSPARADFYSRLADVTDGHMVTPSLSAEHNLQAETWGPVEKVTSTLRSAATRVPPTERATEDFALYGPEDAKFLKAWQAELSENAHDPLASLAARVMSASLAAGKDSTRAAADAIASVKDFLDAQPEEWLQQYERHTMVSPTADPTVSPHEDWARVVTAKVKGAVTGADGTLHADLLDRVGNGGTFGRGTAGRYQGLLADIPKDQLPAQIKGRVYVPDGSGGLDRIANVGFRRVLNPMINYLSREPLFSEEAYRQYRLLAPQVESGALGEDQAMNLALSRASNKAIRFVHNLNERSQWSTTARNWMPFGFAQEQAYKRVFRLLAENPGAFRQYQMFLSAVANVGAQKTDANGNNYWVYPGTGWLGKYVPKIASMVGLPVEGSSPTFFSANLGAAAVIAPFAEGVRPEVGPVVAIPIKAIANLFPEFQSVEAGVLGQIGAGQSFWRQLVPNTAVQRILDAAAGDSVGFNSTVMHTLQALDYEQTKAEEAWVAGGRQGPEPQLVPGPDASSIVRQQFVNRVRNQVRINYATRAILGLIVPISPTVQTQDWGFPQKLQQEITKAGNNISQGMQNFLAKNPDATPWTVFESTSNTGATIPETKAAQDWVQHNYPLIQNYPLAAAWFMPQVDASKYDPTVYAQQVSEGIRTRKTPQEFLNDLYIAAGNQIYYANKPAHDQAVAQLKASGQSTHDETQAWTAFTQQIAAQNPIWYDSFTSAARATDRQQAIDQMTAVFENGEAPPGQQTADLRSLLESYYVYQAELDAGRADSWATASKTSITDNWQSYLGQVMKQSPNLTGVIQKVFMYS